jgi:hypothetical protein
LSEVNGCGIEELRIGRVFKCYKELTIGRVFKSWINILFGD